MLIKPDLSSELTALAEERIRSLMRCWPLLELSATDWLIFEAGMDHAVGRIVLGNMDLKTKLERLKAIHTHRKKKKDRADVTALIKDHRKHSDVRNVVAHCPVLGMSEDQDSVLFVRNRVIPETELIDVEAVSLQKILDASIFASTAGITLLAHVMKLRGEELPQDMLSVIGPTLDLLAPPTLPKLGQP